MDTYIRTMYNDDYMSAQNMYVKGYTSNYNAHELQSADYSHNEIILQAHNIHNII